MADVSKVTNNGLGIITSSLVTAAIKWVGWGTGTTTAANTDTALQTPAAEARVGTNSGTQQTTTATNDTYQVVQTIKCAGTAKAITEVGLFTAATAGTLFFRGTFSPINVSVGDSIQFTIKAQFAQV